RLAASATEGVIRSTDLPESIRNSGALGDLIHEEPERDVVGPAWSSFEERAAAAGAVAAPAVVEGPWVPLSEIERRYLLRVLYHTRGNKKRAAEIMHVDRKTLSRMIERHTVNVARIKRDVRGLR